MKFVICFVFCVVLLTSCATVFSGNSDDVTITSDPTGALVAIDGVPRGRTPLTVDLEKGNSYSVSVSKDGYEAGYATLTNRVGAGWVILDIFAGLVPVVVDAVTGAWGGLSPDTVHLVLTPHKRVVN